MTTMTTILGARGPIGTELAKILAGRKRPFRLVGRKPETSRRRGIVPSRPCR